MLELRDYNTLKSGPACIYVQAVKFLFKPFEIPELSAFLLHIKAVRIPK